MKTLSDYEPPPAAVGNVDLDRGFKLRDQLADHVSRLADFEDEFSEQVSITTYPLARRDPLSMLAVPSPSFDERLLAEWKPVSLIDRRYRQLRLRRVELLRGLADLIAPLRDSSRPSSARTRSRLRELILERDCETCRKCGNLEDDRPDRYPAGRSWMEVDHIIPHQAGGFDQPWNLETLCRLCNKRKNCLLVLDDLERALKNLRTQ